MIYWRNYASLMVFDAEIGKRDWICKGESGDDGHWLCWWMVLVLGQAQGLQRCSKGLAKSSKVYVCIYIYRRHTSYLWEVWACYSSVYHMSYTYSCHIYTHAYTYIDMTFMSIGIGTHCTDTCNRSTQYKFQSWLPVPPQTHGVATSHHMVSPVVW